MWAWGLDASGQLLEQNDDEPNSVNSRITRTLAPGSYCLAVESFGGAPLMDVIRVAGTVAPQGKEALAMEGAE